jgi:predicted ester cyclase
MSEENKELVRRFYREWNAHNLDVIDELFADENVAAGVRRGCGAYLAAFPDLHASIEELIAEGDKVVCRANMTGTHDGEIKGIAPTGRQVSVDSAEIYRVKDGSFVGYWCQADVAGLMRQLTEEQAARTVTAGSPS